VNTLLRQLIEASGLSRRKAFAAIREGRLKVDGRVRSEPSEPFEGGELILDGVRFGSAPVRKTYLILNKPPGYVTTRSDELGRRTVYDLVPAGLRSPGLHSAGRLDRDTSGLLLLTDDGELTHALTHPRHEVEKEYWLHLARPASEAQLASLREGVELDGRLRRVARLRRLVGEGPFQLSVTIREGRKRQVRRMFEAVGARVTALRRVREGSLDLADLPEGAVRQLTETEVQALREAGELNRERRGDSRAEPVQG
jgi:23S rRNA pseudouridine2605 synthase